MQMPYGIAVADSEVEGMDFHAHFIDEQDNEIGAVDFTGDTMQEFMDALPDDDEGKEEWRKKMYEQFPGATTTMVALMSSDAFNSTGQNILFYLILNGTVKKWQEESKVPTVDMDGVLAGFMTIDIKKLYSHPLMQVLSEIS